VAKRAETVAGLDLETTAVPPAASTALAAHNGTHLAVIVDESAQVMSLFDKAIAQGAGGVAALEQLVNLHDRVQRRRAELEFSRALVAFQQNCPPIPKSSTANIPTKGGGSFKYTYADLEQIIETIRPHLAAQGFSFSFDSAVADATLTCFCTLRHANGHSDTTRFSLTTTSASAMSEQQKVGAALTFAKRQTLTSILGLSLTDAAPEQGTSFVSISDEQVANLEALIQETGSDRGGFLKYLGIDELAELPLARYSGALALMEQKRKAAKP
jgi:hypothetical protein